MFKMSKLILIAAVANNRIIGKDGQIPWRIPEDMKRFKELTIGHPVIMGRKTYDSLPERFRPLPERTNIVVSRTKDARNYPPDVLVYDDIDEAIRVGKKVNDLIYVIGGQQIYGQTIDLADRLEITEIHRYVEGDAIFPRIDKNRWRETFRENHDDFSFVTYEH